MKIKFINFFLITLLGSLQLARANDQNFVISQVDGMVQVRTDMTRELVFFSEDASEAIQWALDHVISQGDEIPAGEVLIGSGDYFLSKGLRIGSNIWLRGKGSTTRLIANAFFRIAINVQDASFTVISDMTLIDKSNVHVGIELERSVNCQVLNTYISGFTDGIRNSGQSALTLINNNVLSDNTTSVMVRNGGGVIGRWIPLFISENTILGGTTGINCNAMVVNILNNTIHKTKGRGIHAGTNSIVVHGNSLTRIGGDYAIFGTGAEFNCSGNTLSGLKGNGIRTRTRWGNITGNLISNLGQDNEEKIGIHIVNDKFHEGPAESKTITGNVIQNDAGFPKFNYGIKEDGGFTNVITGNIISGFAKGAVASTGEGTIVTNNQELKATTGLERKWPEWSAEEKSESNDDH